MPPRLLSLPLVWLAFVLLCVTPAVHAQAGVLVVESTPAGGLVYLGTAQAGRTPLTTLLPVGPVRVRVLRPGSDAFERTVTVASGDTLRIMAMLETQTGRVVPGSLPAGATLRVGDAPADGPAEVVVGTVPVALTLASGEVLRARVRVDARAETRVSFTSRALDLRAAALGLVIPGGAQFRGGRAGVGAALVLGVGAGVAGTVLMRGVETRAGQRLDAAYAVYHAAQTETDALSAFDAVDREADAQGRARTLRTVATGTAVAVAVASAIDAFVHHTRRPGLVADRPRPLSASLGPGGRSLQLTLSL